MAVPFEYPPENMSMGVGLLNYANTLVEGWLGTGLLIFIAIIALISTKSFSTEKSFGFTAFLIFIIGLLFRFMNLINDAVFHVTILMLVGAVVWLVTSREQEQM